MICQNCRKGFQATEEWTRDHGIYTTQPKPHLIHPTYRSFLKSILHGCPICRCAWRHLVQSRKKEYPGVDADLPNHDEVQAHLELIRRLAEAHSLSRDKPAPTLRDATVALEISDARSEDESESEMRLIHQLWQQTTPVLDPLSDSCPVVVSSEGYQFGVSANLLADELELVSMVSLAYFHVVPIPRHDADLHRLKRSMGGYGKKACTSANPKLWKLWMGLCLEQHDECGKTSREQPSFSPRRLIKINSNDKINRMTWRLRIIGDTEKCPYYLTLSHCWGTLQHHHTLTGATLEHFLQNEIPVSELPKTFQDAISITLSMGFRYIWIDSLCIIQDDVDDWKDQSSVMGLIYKHAMCNIAATWARNGAEGCFSPRNPADVEPKPWKIKFTKGLDKEKQECRVIWANYEGMVECAPLNTRGWVLQERCLSARQLQFTKDEVYWECSRSVASERFPAGKLMGYHNDIQVTTRGKLRLDHRDKHEVRHAWVTLVQNYSRARLTVYTDKTIAISGLASEIRELHGDQYLAGLWKNDLHRQLCWSVDSLREDLLASGYYRKPGPYIATRHYRETGPYIAPTWSWMSIDSAVTYDETYWGHHGSRLHLAQVLSASVRSSHSSGLHSFLNGSLRMRVLGMWCCGVVGRFERGHILEQPSDPAKRSAVGFSALLQGQEIAITWDEGTGDEYEAREDDSGGDEEESGDDEVRHGEGLNREGRGNEEGGICEDGVPLPPDPGEQNNGPAGLARGGVDMRRSDLLLGFVHFSTGKQLGRKLQGLVLVEKPGSGTEFVRLGVFNCGLKSVKGERKNGFIELIESRFGWNGREFGDLKADLGDPRFVDLVHTVTVV